jgi:uncharacterized protein (DUF58 family)
VNAARRGSLFRVSSLVLPSYCAWSVAFDATASSELQHEVVVALGGLGLLTCVALFARVVDAMRSRWRGETGIRWLEALDVLTASGSSMAWFGAGAVLVSVWVGWASAAVVGLFGLGVLHLVILWTLLRVGGADPWRRASLSRGFRAAVVTEGDPVIEELRFMDPRIPAGFRLLARGRVGPRWAQSRYALESDESRGEVRLESNVGPALRGEHDAELLSVWLQDVLGLCHSAYTVAGAARLTVLPRPRRIEGAGHLLGQGGEDKEPRAAVRLPTEGSLRLREYQPGDDARRIH